MVKVSRAGILVLLLGGIALAQEAGNIFEKAPPEVDEALRARITRFYQAFIDGKFRLADALVADDSKDVFFAAEKRRYHACEIGNITYTDHFTKAKAVVSCDTEYFMMGRQIPVKLPISSLWKIENGEWFWYTIPVSEQDMVNTPIGPVKRAPLAQNGNAAPAPSVVRPMVSPGQLMAAVKVDRESMVFNSSHASSQELKVKNTMPGVVTLLATTNVAGLSVKPEKVQIQANEEVKVVAAFNPEDPAITCSDCLSHPQDRKAGDVTLRVEPTNQVLSVPVKFVVPAPAK